MLQLREQKCRVTLGFCGLDSLTICYPINRAIVPGWGRFSPADNGTPHFRFSKQRPNTREWNNSERNNIQWIKDIPESLTAAHPSRPHPLEAAAQATAPLCVLSDRCKKQSRDPHQHPEGGP